MSECPKCKQKINLLYLKQNCPHCDVNIRFYNFEENFYRDAKKAELSVAKINIFIAHIKASYIGSRLTIARLCVMLLPIVSFLVPFGNVTFSQPFVNSNISVSATGIYTLYEKDYLQYILTMSESEINSKAFILLAIALVMFILAALAGLLIFFMTLLCFLSIKKTHRIIAGTAVTGAVFSVISALLVGAFSLAAKNLDLVSGELSAGVLVSVALFSVVAVINILIGKQGLNIVYAEGDVERVAIAKKVKAGEISIDDLPQPVVETAETEKIRIEIERQQALYQKSEEGEEHA